MAVAVIRSQGERTAAQCERLVRRQFESVHVLSISPFADAVRECLRIGIESGADWLVTVDADVLIAPDYWQRIQPHLSGWHVLGKMDCKLGGLRAGGVRAWRTDSLADALPMVTDCVRPESALCHAVGGWSEVDVITGRHDYEQFYRDLYRKGAAHRVKHRGWAYRANYEWRRSSDLDLIAAYAGWSGQPLKMQEKPPL